MLPALLLLNTRYIKSVSKYQYINEILFLPTTKQGNALWSMVSNRSNIYLLLKRVTGRETPKSQMLNDSFAVYFKKYKEEK